MKNQHQLFLYCLMLLTCFCVTNCNYLIKPSLTGKKLYLLEPEKMTLYGITVPVSATELEFDFTSNEVVNMIPTAYYGVNKRLVPLSTKTISKNYTYQDGILTIDGIATKGTKLTESDTFYTDDLGEVLFKKSILELSPVEKAERLDRTLDHPKDLQTNFLDKEVIPSRSVSE